MESRFPLATRIISQSDWQVSALIRWIRQKSIPLAGEYASDTARARYRVAGVERLCVFFTTIDWSAERRAGIHIPHSLPESLGVLESLELWIAMSARIV